MESSIFVFATDLADEGLETVLDNVQERAGIGGITLAASYHEGLDVNAWTIFLHNGALAEAHPDCAPENAFGDRYVTDLCPAHPDVRAFAVALAGDVARQGVSTICAESVHFHGFDHG